MSSKEHYIINLIKQHNFIDNNVIGDDAAIIEDMVYCTDVFLENIHFKIPQFSFKDIGSKSILINVSDILSMNAIPTYALISLSYSNLTRHNLSELISGIKEACDLYGIKIIGGDTTSSATLMLSITMMGRRRNKERFLQRRGLKEGDLIYCTSSKESKEFRVSRDTKYLYLGVKISRNSRLFRPVLRHKFIYEAARFMNSSIDISDGIFNELNILGRYNNLNFTLDMNFNPPLTSPFHLSQSGEEFELLFAIHPKHEARIKNIANKHRIRVLRVARAIKGRANFRAKIHHH